ncbi:MAG: MotA/TolQ/ExbB proton channel family protein, partial [Inhella sp.]
MFSRLSALIATLVVAASLVVAPAYAQDAASAPVAEQTAAAPSANDNPYGLMNLIKNGHAVDQAVLVLLLIMSAGSWFI